MILRDKQDNQVSMAALICAPSVEVPSISPWHRSSSSWIIPRFIFASWLPCVSYWELSSCCVEMTVTTIYCVSFIAIYTILSVRQTAAEEWLLSRRPQDRSTWDSLREYAYDFSFQRTFVYSFFYFLFVLLNHSVCIWS